MTSSAGDSRMSSMSRLYAMPATSTVAPFNGFLWTFSASAILSTVACGIAPLTCPASSMNRGSKPYCLAFHER